MTKSATARRLGIVNDIPEEHVSNVARTMFYLDLIRDYVGQPVHVTSGYRNPELNEAVGGVATSHHAKGWAADIWADEHGAYGLAEKVVALAGEARQANPDKPLFEFDQCILETYRGVVHVSFAPAMRGEILTQAGGPGTEIVKGLVKP